MNNENCFLKIVCGTSLLLINTVVLANSSQVTTDSITSNNSNVGQTAPFHLAQLGPNKSDVVTSTQTSSCQEAEKTYTCWMLPERLQIRWFLERKQQIMGMPVSPMEPEVLSFRPQRLLQTTI